MVGCMHGSTVRSTWTLTWLGLDKDEVLGTIVPPLGEVVLTYLRGRRQYETQGIQ